MAGVFVFAGKVSEKYQDMRVVLLRVFGHCFSFVACTNLEIFKLEYGGLYLDFFSWVPFVFMILIC